MSIRTRLIILFLYIGIIPMILLGTALYVTSEKVITNTILNQLNSVASVQHDRVKEVIEQNIERIRFLSSVPELQNFANELSKGNTQVHTDVLQLFDHAAQSMDAIETIALLDLQGATKVISSKGHIQELTLEGPSRTVFEQGSWSANIAVGRNKDGNERIYLAAPVNHNGIRVGVLVIIQDTRSIAGVTQSYIGLGDSGESVIAQIEQDGTLTYIFSRRFEEGALAGPKEPTNLSSSAMKSAQSRDTGTYTDVYDYRGTQVYAASRYIHDADWILLVKVDRREALFFAMVLVNILMSLTCLLIILSIMMAIRFGATIAEPIRKLSKASKNLVNGISEPMDIPQNGDREVTELIKDFSQMRDTIQMNQDMLQSMVDQKTQQLSGKVTELEKANSLINSASEERAKFQQAVESSHDAIFFIDPKKSIVYANPAWREMFGYAPDDLEEKSFDYIFSEDADWEIRKALLESFDKAQQFSAPSITGKRKDQKTFEMECTMYPILREDGSLLYYVGILRNISEHKRLERAKSEFLSLASHELGTPLSKISWTFEVIMDGIDQFSETQQQLMKTAYENLLQMSGAINRMLLISRIESNAVRADTSLCNLHQLLQELQKKHQPQYDAKNILLSVSCPQDVSLRADSHLLSEILTNIIHNAILYTPEGGKVAVRCAADNNTIDIAVSDTGIGIPYSEQSRIFSKLFRAENAMRVDTDGAGLGLYVCKALTEVLGGTITFTSEEHKGSTFIVSFPADLKV